MKRYLSVVLVCLIAVMTMGVNKCQVSDNPLGLLAVKNSARALGYAIANSKSTTDDAAVVEAYTLFKTGQVDPVKMNELLAKFNKDPANQLLVLAALDLIEAMGATVTNGAIVDLSGIPPELWKTVEVSYQQGYALGKTDKSKGITRAIP